MTLKEKITQVIVDLNNESIKYPRMKTNDVTFMLAKLINDYHESDNNGWIKIESEEQYDELENGEYEWYNINNSKYDKGDLWAYGTFTHYKIVPILRSDAPLY